MRTVSLPVQRSGRETRSGAHLPECRIDAIKLMRVDFPLFALQPVQVVLVDDSVAFRVVLVRHTVHDAAVHTDELRADSECHGHRNPRPNGLEEHVVRITVQKALARKDQPHPRLDTHELREISVLGVHEQVVELEIPREIVAHDVKAPNRLRQRGAARQGAQLGGNGGRRVGNARCKCRGPPS